MSNLTVFYVGLTDDERTSITYNDKSRILSWENVFEERDVGFAQRERQIKELEKQLELSKAREKYYASLANAFENAYETGIFEEPDPADYGLTSTLQLK